MADKKQLKTTPGLKNWFLTKPLKFALLSFGLMAITVFLYSMIFVMITGSYDIYLPPIFILVFASLVFAGYKLIKWLPSENLDRYSFIAVSGGLNLIYFTSIFLSSIFLIVQIQKTIMFYMLFLEKISVLLVIITVFILSIVYLYIMGIMIANVYSIYLRGRKMGVSKTKSLLSLPFGVNLFWFPGYLLPDNSSKKSITLKSGWYKKLTDWIIKSPINSIIVYLGSVVFSILFFDINILFIISFITCIFGVWLAILGPDKFKKTIGGAYASFAAIINIALIILFFWFFVFAPISNTQITTITERENIEITDTTILKP